MSKPRILIVISGGVAQPIAATADVEIHIVDRDAASLNDDDTVTYSHEVHNMVSVSDAQFAREFKQAKE